MKLLAVAYKGGKCEICGYNRCVAALDFHHVDPEKKDFNISKVTRSRLTQEVKNELDKCVLLCSRCHREVEDGFTKLPNRLTRSLTSTVDTSSGIDTTGDVISVDTTTSCC